MFEAPIIIPIISAFVSLATVALNIKSVQRNRKIEAEIHRKNEISSVQEPLLQAAQDLQSRIYNILEGGFFETYLPYPFKSEISSSEIDSDIERRAKYAVEHSAYLFSQYFFWAERYRLEIQQSDAQRYSQVQDLVEIQGFIERVFGTDSLAPIERHPSHLMLFKGEQRSIAEAMTIDDNSRPTCRGFNSFISDTEFNKIDAIRHLKKSLRDWGLHKGSTCARLALLQNNLIALLNHLDGQIRRLPERRNEAPIRSDYAANLPRGTKDGESRLTTEKDLKSKYVWKRKPKSTRWRLSGFVSPRRQSSAKKQRTFDVP